jgi:ATP-dependent Zn protease
MGRVDDGSHGVRNASTGVVERLRPGFGGGGGGDAAPARNELAEQWRKLTRAATFVAVLTSPLVYAWYSAHYSWDVGTTLFATFLTVVAFRGFVDLVTRHFIPWPSLFGYDDARYREEDVIGRRRWWFWRSVFRFARLVIYAVVANAVIASLTGFDLFSKLGSALTPTTALQLVLQLMIFFFINMIILVGPLMAMGIGQIKASEPGDATWGVDLADVRGQAEPKEEIRRVVTLWQSSQQFTAAGGKPERGLLFLGAPGTGKTMLAKAIATSFNCPFVSIPGSGFAQTFIGMDAMIVRYLSWKAKRLARKWGGQCIVFIDEIDAVGMRRASLGAGGRFAPADRPPTIEDHCFHGPWGARTSSGDLFLETSAWRERIFADRADPRRPTNPLLARVGGIANYMVPGMFGGGGGLALNQLLVVMDGIGNPPFWRRFWTNRTNTILDAVYIVPRRLRRMPLRLRRAKPRNEQIFFIGACNVPIAQLDPALVRPGRMGRHIYFRTPTKDDRKDIFDLYLDKVSHEPDLDTAKRRDELARITMGYSPAMIEQVCSMALTIAHHEGRERFGWLDVVESMTNIETGTAQNIDYVPAETRAVAIHEAGHAVCAHVYMKGSESTRLSIRKRGGSLGHHSARKKDERFSSWRSEDFSELIWGLGAMAAEHVFYGENSSGVGGDVGTATTEAAWMVGAHAMFPERVDLEGKFALQKDEDEAREKIMKHFEQLGLRIMNRTSSPEMQDSIAAVLSDPAKRAAAAQILGQAYVIAYNLIEQNREAVETVAETLMERKELHGDEVIELLDSVELREPLIDLTRDRAWPKL